VPHLLPTHNILLGCGLNFEINDLYLSKLVMYSTKIKYHWT